MAPRKPSRSWRLFRIYFRHFRIGVWLAILALLGALLYLNQIGLPGFVKRPLLEKLYAQGIDLQFTRLRLRFDRGIVADNVLFGGTNDASGPTLALKEIQVRLDYFALLKRQIQVRSLVLRQGRLAWPVGASNEPPRELAVENIQTELRFLPGDLWQLDQFKAQFAGATIQFAGTVANASAIREWKIFQLRPAAPQSSQSRKVQQRLRELADTLEQIRFPSTPELNLEIHGDARALSSFGGRLSVRAPGAETPWGTFAGCVFLGHVLSPSPGEPSRAEIILRADLAQTRWATAGDLDLTLDVLAAPDPANFNADLKLTAARVETPWGRGSNVNFTAQWLHSATNPVPISGRGELQLAEAETPWGNGRGLRLIAGLAPRTNAATPPGPAWAWWTNLAPHALELNCRLAQFASPELAATNLLCLARWQAPELDVSRLGAELCGGRLEARAHLDVDTRQLSFTNASDFDVKKSPSLLPLAGRQWLSQFSWEKPPRLNAEGALILPAWTNRNPDWFTEVKPTAWLRGQASVARSAFRGAQFDSADFHFTYTNFLWRLPDLVATRPEGRLEMSLESNEANQDFYFHLHSTVDPNAARPLLTPKQQGGFDLVAFTEPPVIDGEIRGRWHDLDRLAAKATVTVTNFTVRGVSASGLQTEVAYTNRVLTLREPRVQRGLEHLQASSVSVDLAAEKVFITNGFGMADPAALTHAIGPVSERAMEPYHFVDLPTARVEGVIGFHGIAEDDLRFDILNTGAFEWWKFKLSNITGKIHWAGDKLWLQDIHTDFYHGTGTGMAAFDFATDPGTGIRFDFTATDADLHLLMNDLSTGTNRLEGLLNGRLTVTEGDAGNPDTWQGNGRASLRDGLIWEIPVFGALTPALESIAPGLGSKRAGEGNATFVLTNGMVHSDDLELRASGMRLQYRGDVDLAGRVDARVEAELLRDTWVVGRVLSMALWPVSKIFEFKISGNLANPKMEPLYFFPKLLLMPLHPIDAMKELLTRPPDSTKTNSPPASAP